MSGILLAYGKRVLDIQCLEKSAMVLFANGKMGV
jgi:hypothetical protein